MIFIILALMMVVSCVSILAACQPSEQNPEESGTEDEKLVRDPEAEYTYNTFLSTFPTVWNNHTYQTATDGEIIGYTEPGFYTFDYNETLDGYKLVPDMATSEPVDVTANYVGDAWGIAEGDTAKAWKITLRQDIKWEDGTPIKAADFVESAKRLLNPVANNYRADGLYSGNMVIHNAKNYFYGGKDVDEDNGATGYFTRGELVKGDDGVYTTAAGEPVWIATNAALDWLGGYTLDFYTDYYGDAMFDMTAYASLKALADENGNVKVTDESLALLTSVITFSPSWGETEEEVVQYMMYANAYPEISFDTVSGNCEASLLNNARSIDLDSVSGGVVTLTYVLVKVVVVGICVGVAQVHQTTKGRW